MGTHWIAMNTINIAKTILNALVEPVLVLDDTLRAVAANPSFYSTLRVPPGRLKGKEVQELIVEDRDAQHFSALLASIAAHESNEGHLEVECAVAPGIRKVLSITARRVSFGDDSPELILLELHDITGRKDAERKVLKLNTALQAHTSELELINQDLESFTYSVSHDLRAPLRLTNKIAHLLLQDHGSELSTDATLKVQMILDSTREMGKLIEDLLAFSQVRHQPVKKRPIGMRRLAHEALGELRNEQEGHDVSVTIDNLPSCLADRALMKQVFLNLLTNALKFTRQREKVEIQISTAEQCIHTISGSSGGENTNAAERHIGKLASDLAYTDIEEILKVGIHEYIDQFQTRLNLAGAGVSESFFGYN